MATPDAKTGDVLVIVACCEERGPVAVQVSARASWRCGHCRSAGTDVETIVLGVNGALPDNYDPLADSPRCWKQPRGSAGCSRLAAHSGDCVPIPWNGAT